MIREGSLDSGRSSRWPRRKNSVSRESAEGENPYNSRWPDRDGPPGWHRPPASWASRKFAITGFREAWEGAGNPEINYGLANIICLCNPCHLWVHENPSWLMNPGICCTGRTTRRLSR